MSAHKGVERDTEMGGVSCSVCGWHLAGLHTNPHEQERMHHEAYPEEERDQ